MYLLAPFILQNFKKILRAEPVIRMYHLWSQNDPFVLNKSFLLQTIIITFIYLLALFTVQNLKNSYSRSKVMRISHFWAQNGLFAPNKYFFGKLLIFFSSTYQTLSLRKILKKFFQVMQSYEDVHFLGPKWPISSNKNFFKKPANEPCFFYSCLFTCEKSRSDINLLVKYRQLKNTGISLAEKHFWLQLESQIFPKHAVFPEC